jgi:hypothetical protein
LQGARGTRADPRVEVCVDLVNATALPSPVSAYGGRIFIRVNVAFHEFVGIALAQEAAAWLGAPPPAPTGDETQRRRFTWGLTFALAVLSHGALDGLPHYYPLGSAGDTVVSILLVGGWLWMVPRWLRGPGFLICVGALLPDIIDHVPDDLRKHLGLPIPVPPNLFPWHWPTNTSSLVGRTGPLWVESTAFHVIVVAFATAAIARTRHVLRAPRPHN